MQNKRQAQRNSLLGAEHCAVHHEVEVNEAAMFIMDANAKKHNAPNIIFTFRVWLDAYRQTDIDFPRGSRLTQRLDLVELKSEEVMVLDRLPILVAQNTQ